MMQVHNTFFIPLGISVSSLDCIHSNTESGKPPVGCNEEG